MHYRGMSLAGEGVVAIWHGIRPEGRADFFEWHNREHMPERVAIAGFLRGRRYIALEGQPEFFTLYETATSAVLSGADYLARLNAPTQWTRRATSHFTDTARSLCRVAFSTGVGAGGIETEEKKGRPKNAVPGWVALVEGGSERHALEAACARIAIPNAERGLYQLQHTRNK